MSKTRASAPVPQGEVLIYQAGEGDTRIEVRLEDETVWLSQQQMAELFQTTRANISLHIGNIYEEGELSPEGTFKDFLQVRKVGAQEVAA